MPILNRTGPAFASVTWGAGGTETEKSLGLAVALQEKRMFQTLMHITTSNTTASEIKGTLTAAKKAQIRNLLVLRGDRADANLYSNRGSESSLPSKTTSPHAFSHANELVSFIQKEFPGDFCIGVAGNLLPNLADWD